MRSVLIPHSSKSTHSVSCRLCQDLGYYSDSTIQLDTIVKSNKFTTTKNILLPCEWILNTDIEHIKNELEKDGKCLKFVFSFEQWKGLSKKIKGKYPSNDIAIVYEQYSDLKHQNPANHNYYMIKPDNWNFTQWSLLNCEFKEKLKLFFIPNFNTEEAFSLALKIRQHDQATEFSYPFGHDVIDNRNKDHLTWNLIPDLQILSENFERAIPLISIIVPFHNRTKLLIKVLKFLNQQTLEHDKFEVILMDDGSEETQKNTLHDFLQKLHGLNYKYIFVKRNIPLTKLFIGNRAGPMRNLGAHFSRSDILLFLDSDILLPQNYLINVINESLLHDITLSRRVYLNKEKTESDIKNFEDIKETDIYQAPWQGYLNQFYEQSDWQKSEIPWKYFITYALTVKKPLFQKAGGFRTNYISFGYEDLDLGFRIMKLDPKLKLLKSDVYHLYHFDDKASEYTLNLRLRFFQLAMTSRTFIIQNMPLEAPYLLEMVKIRGKMQKITFQFYGLLWKIRRIKNNKIASIKKWKQINL